MAKKRKRNNNHSNNNHLNKKKNIKKKKKNKHFLGPKITLAVLLGILTFSESKSCDLEKLLSSETRIVQTTKYQPTLEQIYQNWMFHYNLKGFDLDFLEKKSEILQDFLDRINSQAKGSELIDKPYDEFLHSDKKYDDYSLSVMSIYYFPFNSEFFISEIYKRCFDNPSTVKEKIKGLKEVEDYFIKNYYELIKKDDDELARWALNAAYFITRKNLKANSFVNSNSKEDLEKAFENSYGDCEILTYFTKETYLTLIRELKKKHLSKKIQSNMGFVLEKRKKHTVGHHWLTFEYKGKKTLVETNSFNDDYLFFSDEKYDSDKTYIKGPFLNCFYVPLFSTSFASGTDKDFTHFKKIHILPKEIELKE